MKQIPGPGCKAVFALGTRFDPSQQEWIAREPREVVVDIVGTLTRNTAQVRENPPSYVTWNTVRVLVHGEHEPRPVDVERFVRSL